MKNVNTTRGLPYPRVPSKIFTQIATLLLIFFLTIMPDQSIRACMGTPVPPCGRSVVLAKFTPGTVVFPAAGAINVPIGVLPFAWWNPTGLPNAPICPQPVAATLNLTLTCFPSGTVIGPQAFAVATPTFPGAQPVGGPVNFIIPAGVFPPGSPPQICLVVGTYTVTFSDGVVLSFTGDTEVCLTPPSSLDASVPQLEMQYIPVDGNDYRTCRRGDQANFYFLVANNDPDLSVSLDLNSIGRQISHLPEGFDTGNAYQNDVYSISLPEPGTDAFAASFAEDLQPGELLAEPDPSVVNDQELSRSFSLAPCEAIIICITMRSYGMCANGSCNERLVKVEGTFSDGSPALACASTLYVVDEAPAKSVLCEVADSVKVGENGQAIWSPGEYSTTDGPFPHAQTFSVGNLPPNNPGFQTTGSNQPDLFPSSSGEYTRIDGIPMIMEYSVQYNSPVCGNGQNIVRIQGIDNPNINEFSIPIIAFVGSTAPLEIILDYFANQISILIQGDIIFQGPIDLFFADPPPEFCIDPDMCRIIRKRSDFSNNTISAVPKAFSPLFDLSVNPDCDTTDVFDNSMGMANWNATISGAGIILPSATGIGELEFCYDDLGSLAKVPATTISYIDISSPGALNVFRVPVAIRVKDSITSVSYLPPVDDQFVLHTNVPNPFSTQTTISCTLLEASQLSLQIFNHLGQSVNHLVLPQKVEAGAFSIEWNGTDDAGKKLNPGIYICQMRADEKVKMSKLLLIR